MFFQRCLFVSLIVVGLVFSGCYSGSKTTDDIGPIEMYALQNGRLAPEVVAILKPFFTPLGFDIDSTVRVRVHNDWFGSVGIRGTPSATGVLGNTIHVISGVLDADGIWIRNNYWSWEQPVGIARWAYEVHHVYQWQNPANYFEKLLPGIFASWAQGELYAHEVIELEQEAITFQHEVFNASVSNASQ